MRKFPRIWLIVAGAFLLGAIVILAVRFFTYDAGYTHYHANFVVYINGQREDFKNASYYEEETACKASSNMVPVDRAHMHDNTNDVVHVHDHAVTWGQFFSNLGWSVGRDFIETRDQTYQNSGSGVLHIFLNGQNLTGLTSIDNKVIGDRDKLLLSYGDISNADLQKEYNVIPSTALQHDEEKDPASCSGPSSTTISERLHHLF
jgi:hypothetical protein